MSRLGRRGFTLLEVLITTGLVAALGGVILVVATRMRTTASGVECLNNMKQVTHALRAFAWDHDNRFPDPGAVEKPWEAMIDRYLSGPHVLICPADLEISPVTGSSYDWRDTTMPESTLAGKSFTDIRRADAVLTIEALPGWHRQKQINVGRIDGTCVPMDASEAMADLLKPIR